MTQKFEEASHPQFDGAEPLLKGDLKSKEGKQTIHFHSTTPTKAIIIRNISDCNQNKEARHRGGPELSTVDLTNMTHRKDLTTSGDRMRHSNESKTIALVSQEAGLSAEVGKGHFLVTRPSLNNEGRWVLVCREYTLPRSNPNSEWVCVLKDNVRMGLVLDTKT